MPVTTCQPKNLTTEQLIAMIQGLERVLEDPITLEFPKNPYCAPCGHTFDKSSLCEALNRRAVCPIDETTLLEMNLVPNRSVKAIANNIPIVIFLAADRVNFQYQCPITREPMFNAVTLPCGHSYNYEGILQWFKHEKTCPRDKKPCTLEQLTPDTKIIEKCCQTYPTYLAKAKAFNENLDQKIVKGKLDDRGEFLHILDQHLSCPLANSLLEEPVISRCGHTFSRSSIKEKTCCPQHKTKKRIYCDQVFPNWKVEQILDLLSQKNTTTATPLRNKTGVFLFLKPDTTLQQVYHIAKKAGLIARKRLRFRVPSSLYFNDLIVTNRNTTLANLIAVRECDEKIPVVEVKP